MHLISHHLFVSAVEAERRGEVFQWTSERLARRPEQIRSAELEVLTPAPTPPKQGDAPIVMSGKGARV
jgi:hypothetical protein